MKRARKPELTKAELWALRRFARSSFETAGMFGVARRIVARNLHLLPRRRGTCAVCGCRKMRACLDGCAWANAEETLCTVCATPEQLRGRRSHFGLRSLDSFFEGIFA